jgi:2-phosphosulfolactate phosphatase
MTTTNGTRAMDRCRGARQIVIGSFANLSRIVQHLHGASRVALVCSGTDRHVTCEDVVFAGAVAEELIAAAAVDAPAWELNDGSKLARCYWQSLVRAGRFPPGEALVELFRHSLGGANLVAQGRAADLEFAARIDRFSNLPVLDQADWQITNHP